MKSIHESLLRALARAQSAVLSHESAREGGEIGIEAGDDLEDATDEVAALASYINTSQEEDRRRCLRCLGTIPIGKSSTCGKCPRHKP